MTRTPTHSEPDPRPLAEQAAYWRVVLNEDTCTAADREAFAAWVRRSPQHIEAFLRVTMVASTLQSKSVSWLDTPAEELIRQARAASAEVVPLGRARESSYAPARRSFSFLSARMLIYASFATVCFGVLVAWMVLSPARFQTEIGEQRSVVLDDGSIITLNTSSEIEVKYDDRRRFIRLVRGEALFNVAHDPGRSFDVDTGKAVIRAVGTQFNIDRRAHRTTVSVVEGKVQVIAVSAPSAGPAADHGEAPSLRPKVEVLAAAQRVVLTDAGMAAPERIQDLAPVIAWTQRQLVFENQPLSEVAAEFNRYNRQHIRIDSAGLSGELVTGVFQANDSSSFLAFVSNIPGVRIETTEEGHYLVSLIFAAEKSGSAEGPNFRP